MQWIESRMRVIEQRVESLYRRLLDDEGVLAGVRQQLRAAFQQGGGGAPAGAGAGFYVCMSPSSGTIQGTWSGGAPTAGGSFAATVYQVSWSGGTPAFASLGTQTVVNWLPAALAASKACVLIPDGSGAYGVASQSCS